MDKYTSIEHHATFEYEDRKSVFIGDAAPVNTEDEALSFIAAIKKKYPDARHHVYAYVLRENSLMRFTDDREPQGTAGMPVLDAIRKNNCTDTVIVVTRYFGGTLLGTGGLVRAYTSAAIGALKSANIITYDIYSSLRISVSYSDYQKLGPIFEKIGFSTDDVRYSDKVTVFGKILKNLLEEFEKSLIDATAGRHELEVIEHKFDYLPVN